MAPRKQKSGTRSVNQLGLNLRGEGFEGPYETRGVFSSAYLSRHLLKSAECVSLDEAKQAFKEIGEIWEARHTALATQNEAFTCSAFLEPILDKLGWLRIPQQSMPNDFSTRKRPDYCLFTTEADFTKASEADAKQLFRLSATVVEAKKYQHPLDRLSTNETVGWFPSQQIQDYLNNAKDSTGKRFFNWAILTNGAEWRLYTEHSSAGAYFSFHLIKNEQFCGLEEFRLFLTLFRSISFERNNEGLCFLDGVREQSLRVQADLETNLRKRIFSVLEDVGTAFYDHEENNLTEKDFPEVYANSLIFLYRLLFVLYAESRGLLPVKSYGPGANKRYLNEFSLARLVDRLRDRTLYSDDAFTGLNEELNRLFHLINGTHARQNEALGVTRYNGGLFNPDLHPKLEQWHLGDESLANVLRQLIFAQPPTRPGQRQGLLSTDEAIDYSTLEVRQLGDIYEGLLGAHFEETGPRLELRNQNGDNHRNGIYYTPDWVVQFLIRETLSPRLEAIESSEDVKRALAARSEEKRRDNSFALEVLKLNLVDPAMGSGHFLVRATEWLADKIMAHGTTRPMTEQIIANGKGKTSREDILKRGKIPVPPGVSQEQAEVAYWRRRVVEACIYGVDINPMAVELAKLSLWLTCIAADEPLNFLDHHLRHGNALLSVAPEEMRRAPWAGSESKGLTFEAGDNLHEALAAVIRQNLQMEGEASTEMEVVKKKEKQWRETRKELQPFLDLADIWLAALDGLAVDEINYLQVARLLTNGQAIPVEEKRDIKRFLQTIAENLADKKSKLTPFHWRLEFPDVFYNENGDVLAEAGFDAVLGNPPYISTQTSSTQGWRDVLEKRAGYLDDLYVHFTEMGFTLLKPDGTFGFIVSDTFFTISTKMRMRELLQSKRLTWLGQCDPFDATVDAAIFVAINQFPEATNRLAFVQARPLKRADGTRTEPDKKLALVPRADALVWNDKVQMAELGAVVMHAEVGELRIHEVPIALYNDCHRQRFFEPSRAALALYQHLNQKVKTLIEEWWLKIETSEKFNQNRGAITKYHKKLKAGEVTLIGLVAEGGQGLATGNNARFLGYLEDSEQAKEILAKREEWTKKWLNDPQVGNRFEQLINDFGGNKVKPTDDGAAWEAAVEVLKSEFPMVRLGFSRMDLIRIAPKALIASEGDFVFAWQQRKQELWQRWTTLGELKGFWMAKPPGNIDDEKFCVTCGELQRWITSENALRKKSGKPPLPKDVQGLRSAEYYSDPLDAPRIATIYCGLRGRARWVPYSKGDSQGNRWTSDQPLYIEWTGDSVTVLQSDPRARWQNHQYFFLSGVSWSDTGNHVALKARELPVSVNDVKSMRLTPIIPQISSPAFLALLNSDLVSYFEKKFVNNTCMYQVNDLRQIPIVVPTIEQNKRLHELAELCISAKRAEFSNTHPDDSLVARTRAIGEELRKSAPKYHHPSAQDFLLATPKHCLSILENAVNWETEKLYGVEGLGPFDEF